MSGSSTFGTITDYATGEAIRPATAAWASEDGRSVYVDGGPDAEITDTNIADLEQEAGNVGDSEQVVLCRKALDGDAGARAECARVILDTRTEFAASA